MTTKHTPGPWEVVLDTGLVREAQSHVEIAHCKFGTKEERHANAHLIAQAPKLLHNLKIITEQLGQIDAVTDDENPAMSQDMLDAFHGIEFHISEAEQAIAEVEKGVAP